MKIDEMNLNPDRNEIVCSECGGMMIFKGRGRFECEECKHTYINDFGKIKSFLEKKGRATAQEVAVATGVSTSKVIGLLKDGSIMLTPDSEVKLHCDCCGRVILHGVYCDRCSSLVNRGELKVEDESKDIKTATGMYDFLSQDNDTPRMRFINNQAGNRKKN